MGKAAPFITIFFLFSCFFLLLPSMEYLEARQKITEYSNAEAEYQQTKKEYEKLASSESQKKQRSAWISTINGFRNIYLKNQTEPTVASKSLFMMGRCYRELYLYLNSQEDADEAIKRFETLAEKFPESNLADDALVLMADLYAQTKRPEQARGALEWLVENYEQGDQYKNAVNELKKYIKKDKEKPSKQLAPVSIDIKPMMDTSKNNGQKEEIRDVRQWSVEDYTRVVMETTGPVSFKEGVLPEDRATGRPARFFLDISPAFLKPDASFNMDIDNALLQKVRVAQFDRNTVRVVFDLGVTQNIKVFNLGDPYRVVVDAFGEGYAEKIACPTQKPPEKVKAQKMPEGKNLSLAQQLGLCVRRIVIDAGHGGKDPGAIGPTGLQEKDVVLKISKKVAHLLKQNLGAEVILTREQDIFLPLEQRTAIANAKKADLFVSIHANAAPSEKLSGVESYFLNFAVDEDAMRVAALENATSQKRIGELQGILDMILKNSKVNESSRLAGFIQRGIMEGLKERYDGINDLGVKQAPFFVLVGARMPSVLVETSFISNRNEERLLKNDKYLDSIAKGITNGIISYATSTQVAMDGNSR